MKRIKTKCYSGQNRDELTNFFFNWLSHLSSSTWIAVLIAGLLSITHVQTGFATVYVDQYATLGADGENEGTSWTDAFISLQDALDCVRNNENDNCTTSNEIWVAAGTYYPDEGANVTDDDRNASFELIPDIAIYGGFVGGEEALEERNFNSNQAILSGDIDQDGALDFNSYHVVVADGSIPESGDGIDADTVLDGFIIEEGYATSTTGGGMLCEGGDDPDPQEQCAPTLRNLTFRGNEAFLGGALYLQGASPEISNVTFHDNKGVDDLGPSLGGAIYIQRNDSKNSNPKFNNVTFSGNEATNGGAIYFSAVGGNSTPSFYDCKFLDNKADQQGGAIFFSAASDASLSTTQFSMCTFEENKAKEGGAIVVDTQDADIDLDLTGAKFFRNSGLPKPNNPNGVGNGGALYIVRGGQGHVNIQISDESFFSQNRSDLGGAIFNTEGNLEIFDTIFSFNRSEGNGGAISFQGDRVGDNGSLLLEDVTFDSNKTIFGDGGAVFCDDAVFEATGGLVQKNEATPEGSGGGFAIEDCTSKLEGIVFEANEAGIGGAIAIQQSADAIFNNLRFYGNTANVLGGAISILASGGNILAELSNNVFSGNEAGAQGGAIYSQGTSTGTVNLYIANGTFSLNDGGLLGGALYNVASSVIFMHNSILFGDTAMSGGEIANWGATTIVAYSNIEGGIFGGNVVDLIAAKPGVMDFGNNQFSKPQFSNTLGSDGIVGTVDDGLELLPTSPLIDAGDNNLLPNTPGGKEKPTDVQGNPRILGRTIDMGAYEQ